MYRISSIFGLQYYSCSFLTQRYFLNNPLPFTTIRSCILSNKNKILIKSRVLKDLMACNNDAIECHTYEIV